MFGSTRLLFLRKADAKPSAGSAVDHIGFSFANVDAQMKEFEAAGIKIVTPVREVPGLFKLGFPEDPWGTRIEVVQDPELLGLHHIHVRGPNPDEVFTWLLGKFGGQRRQLKGRADAIKYSAPGFMTCGSSCSAATRNQVRGTRSITSAGVPPVRSRSQSTTCAPKA